MGARRLTEWVVLGSGSYEPSLRGVRFPAGHALLHSGRALLFDLGFGDLQQLLRAGIDPARVTHAFFTHRHPDHVGDLAALLFMRHCARPRTRGTLRLFGPPGFKAFLRRLSAAHAPWLAPRGGGLRVTELRSGGEVAGPGWKVRAHAVPHGTPALAYRFDAGKAAVCYSGDTGADPGLAAFAAGADLFVLECSLTDDEDHPQHLRVKEAVALFEASGARRGLFTHLSGASLRQLAPRLRKLRASAAEDLQRVRIG